MDRDIMIALNNDKKLILPINKIGSIMVPDDFVLKHFSIDDKEVTNQASIKQMNDIIALIIPNHTCTVMDINYDLLSIPVVFHNDVDKELTIVINNKITVKLAPKKTKSYKRGASKASPNSSERRIKMVELPIPTPSQGSLFDLKINGKQINSEVIQELNSIIGYALEGEMPNIIINQELLDRGFSGAAYYNQ